MTSAALRKLFRLPFLRLRYQHTGEAWGFSLPRRGFSAVFLFVIRSLHFDKSFRRAGALLVVLVLGTIVVVNGQQTEHARQVGKRLMCVCGCNQVLTECNHIGCRYSHDMLKELDDRVTQNQSDDLTLQAFVQEYGSAVLLVPIAKGFNRWVWIMPVILPLAGLWITQRAIARWRKRPAVASPVAFASPELLARVERESRNPGDS